MTRRQVGIHVRHMGATFQAARKFVDAVRDTVAVARKERNEKRPATRRALKRAAKAVEPLIVAVLELDVALRKAVRKHA